MTSVNHEPECPYADNDDLLRRYAAGKVDGEEADRFEEHFLGCDRCWNEIREVAHLRSALGDRKLVPRRASARRITPILATAAAAVLVILGAWNLYDNFRTPDRTIWRSPRAGAIAVSAVRQASAVSIRWNRIPAASSYVVSIFTTDGTLIQRAAVTATSLTVPLEPTGAASELHVRVEAVDSTGRTISESSLQRVSATE